MYPDPYPTKGYLNLKPVSPPTQETKIHNEGFKYAIVYKYPHKPEVVAIFSHLKWAQHLFDTLKLSPSHYEIREIDN